MYLDREDVCRGFSKHEFSAVFQPLVKIKTGQLVGFEALTRWNHCEIGAVSPGTFIPIIQSSGLTSLFTKTQLQVTFSATSLLSRTLRLSMNLSPQQLLDGSLPEQVAAAAAAAGLSLDRLTIEITERALQEDLDRVQAACRSFKQMGCLRLSLDDFGTGHSSLFHLQAAPFDELKVDRSFILRMRQDSASRKIVAAVVGLGKSFALDTVAEGVETAEQAAVLCEVGCVYAQGWLYGMPAPAETIPDMAAAPAGFRPGLPAFHPFCDSEQSEAERETRESVALVP